MEFLPVDGEAGVEVVFESCQDFLADTPPVLKSFLLCSDGFGHAPFLGFVGDGKKGPPQGPTIGSSPALVAQRDEPEELRVLADGEFLIVGGRAGDPGESFRGKGRLEILLVAEAAVFLGGPGARVFLVGSVSLAPFAFPFLSLRMGGSKEKGEAEERGNPVESSTRRCFVERFHCCCFPFLFFLFCPFFFSPRFSFREGGLSGSCCGFVSGICAFTSAR